MLYCSDSRIQDRMKEGPHLGFSEHAILHVSIKAQTIFHFSNVSNSSLYELA